MTETEQAIIGTMPHMVVDSLSRLLSYRALCPGLSSLMVQSTLPEFTEYKVDREHIALFSVMEGVFLASTTWRENPLSREPVAALRLETGMFALYLPGEPFLVKQLEPGQIDFYLL